MRSEIVQPRLRRGSRAKLLRRYADARAGQPVACLQIGANDGAINDPVHPFLRDYAWRGLLVEPLSDVFAHQLARTYAGNPRVTLVNRAIAPAEGVLTLHRLAFSRERWATGLTSACRTTIEKHIASGYIRRQAAKHGTPLPADERDWIEATSVQTTTVAALLAAHDFPSYDVLCVDTEGFDFEVLKLADLSRHRPDLVIYESKHLRPADALAAQALFGPVYRLFRDGGDTIAVRIGSAADPVRPAVPLVALVATALRKPSLAGLRPALRRSRA